MEKPFQEAPCRGAFWAVEHCLEANYCGANHHNSWALGCWWGYDQGMVLATWESFLSRLLAGPKRVHELQEPFHSLQSFITGFTWCPPFLHPNPKHLAHFCSQPLYPGLPLLCPLTYSCCPRVWPTRRQQMPNCNEKSFSFSDQNKNLKHWKFHSRASAREVSKPWELPIIQLNSNHLKANLSSILALNSSEFTSHYPLASVMLSPLALLTCMHFGGIKSGTAPDPFHRKVCFDLLHLLEMSQNIKTSRHLRGCTKHLSV